MLRQDVGDGNGADRGTVDHDWYILPGLEDLSCAMAFRSGVGVDLDLAIHEVDDPVDGDAAAGVPEVLDGAVDKRALLCDLDDEWNISTVRLFRVVAGARRGRQKYPARAFRRGRGFAPDPRG